jgi:6-phosphogluconolactonase (cycloisomerase 2 family)
LSGAFGFAIENGFAYIANQFSNTVSVCKVNPVTGALSGCGYTGIGFGSPKGIAIRNGFAYITNQSSGDVISCVANSSTGLLTSCNVTGNGFNNPVGIATN